MWLAWAWGMNLEVQNRMSTTGTGNNHTATPAQNIWNYIHTKINYSKFKKEIVKNRTEYTRAKRFFWVKTHKRIDGVIT